MRNKKYFNTNKEKNCIINALIIHKSFSTNTFICKNSLFSFIINCFIILRGRFLKKSKKQSSEDNPEYLIPGDACGNFQEFSGNRWKFVEVIAVDPECAAIEIDRLALAKLLAEENSNVEFKNLLIFLQKTIPGFQFQSLQTQERLAHFFHPKEFLPGVPLIKEGKVAASAFLIKEGECKVVSDKSPLRNVKLEFNSFEQALQYKKYKNLHIGNCLSGYLSASTNKYQLQTVQSGEWVGEELSQRLFSF